MLLIFNDVLVAHETFSLLYKDFLSSADFNSQSVVTASEFCQAPSQRFIFYFSIGLTLNACFKCCIGP